MYADHVRCGVWRRFVRGSREISLVPSLHRASTDALVRAGRKTGQQGTSVGTQAAFPIYVALYYTVEANVAQLYVTTEEVSLFGIALPSARLCTAPRNGVYQHPKCVTHSKEWGLWLEGMGVSFDC